MHINVEFVSLCTLIPKLGFRLYASSEGT